MELDPTERALDYLATMDAAADAAVERYVATKDEWTDAEFVSAMEKLNEARILPPDLRATVERRRREIRP